MVPVPEELVDAVQQHLNMLMARAAPGEWNQDTVGRLYERLDEQSRAVLTMVAHGVADRDEGPATVASIAEATGSSGREVRGIVVEITHMLQGLGGPQMSLLMLYPPGGADVEASLDDDRRPVLMPVVGANLVLAAADRR
jgi:hypothetical protein